MRTTYFVRFCKKINILDMNECRNGDHDCGDNTSCINTEGSYKCQCYTGYKREVHTNKAINGDRLDCIGKKY